MKRDEAAVPGRVSSRRRNPTGECTLRPVISPKRIAAVVALALAAVGGVAVFTVGPLGTRARYQAALTDLRILDARNDCCVFPSKEAGCRAAVERVARLHRQLGPREPLPSRCPAVGELEEPPTPRRSLCGILASDEERAAAARALASKDELAAAISGPCGHGLRTALALLQERYAQLCAQDGCAALLVAILIRDENNKGAIEPLAKAHAASLGPRAVALLADPQRAIPAAWLLGVLLGEAEVGALLADLLRPATTLLRRYQPLAAAAKRLPIAAEALRSVRLKSSEPGASMAGLLLEIAALERLQPAELAAALGKLPCSTLVDLAPALRLSEPHRADAAARALYQPGCTFAGDDVLAQADWLAITPAVLAAAFQAERPGDDAASTLGRILAVRFHEHHEQQAVGVAALLEIGPAGIRAFSSIRASNDELRALLRPPLAASDAPTLAAAAGALAERGIDGIPPAAARACGAEQRAFVSCQAEAKIADAGPAACAKAVCGGLPLRKRAALALEKAGGEPVPAAAPQPGETDDDEPGTDSPGADEPSPNGE